jgi:hypothetical protein
VARPSFASAVVLLVGVATGACALLVDSDNLTGGATATVDAASSDAGIESDASVTPDPPVGCPAAGRSCVPEAPSGWAGPVLLYDGPVEVAPACPSSLAIARVEGNSALVAPAPHTCTACTCAAGGGATCTVKMERYASVACNNDIDIIDVAKGACTSLSGTASIKVSTVSTGGTCPAAGGVVSRAPLVWGSFNRVCGAPELLRTGCPSGSVCTPDSPNPFRSKHCIHRPEDVACPDGVYTQKTLVVAAIDDTRACSPCTCGPAQNNCAGSAQQFSGTLCFGTQQQSSLEALEPCTTTQGVTFRLQDVTSVSPTCLPNSDGGAPIGSVTPSRSETVCCAP